jgi:hypothetical protein
VLAVLGRDVTEKLLQDESLQGEGEEEGPLADLKRQMRMLSQGSPLLAPQLEQAAAAQAGDEAAAAAAAAPSPAVGQLAGARTPRGPAASMGYADSHHPATLGLLRTGGTTRLLQETVQLGGAQAGGQLDDQDELPEVEGALQDGAAPGGQTSGGGAGGAAATHAGGTTRLLADMTMASSVGAEMLGRVAQGEAGPPPTRACCLAAS